jgi:hypothetical protein
MPASPFELETVAKRTGASLVAVIMDKINHGHRACVESAVIVHQHE